jgi:hypothetical protein
MPDQASSAEKKIGQEFGAIRAPLPLDKLVPFLEKNVRDYKGPLDIQQFKVSPSVVRKRMN